MQVDVKSRQLVGVILLSLDQRGFPNEALFQLRDNLPDLPYPNQWVFPGGHLDPDEDIESGARREFAEETEYACRKLKFLCQGEIEMQDQRMTVSLFWEVYDKVQPIKCHEGQEMRFIGRDQSASFKMPAHLFPWWDLAINACLSET